MHFRFFPLGPYEANCTLIWRDDGSALVVDPGADGGIVAGALRQAGLSLSAVFLTHGHFDHISGVDALLASFPAPVLLHAEDEALAFSRFNLAQPGYGGMARTPLLDLTLGEGDAIPGWPESRILHTPGHSRGSCCLYFAEDALLVAGDTLFEGGSYGRTDLPGGSWPQLERSLERLSALPDATLAICGHGGPTTVGEWRGCR